LRPVAMPSDVAAMVELARSVHVAPALAGYLVDVAEATRRHGSLAVGISPRATLALQRAARTWAAMEGRDFAIPDDAKAVAGPVLSHRLALSPEAHGRVRGAEEVLAEIFDRVPVPVGRPRA
ncbi:MAG: AAA family ATPase, partial [Acidimicrobiales bacterium]